MDGNNYRMRCCPSFNLTSNYREGKYIKIHSSGMPEELPILRIPPGLNYFYYYFNTLNQPKQSILIQQHGQF